MEEVSLLAEGLEAAIEPGPPGDTCGIGGGRRVSWALSRNW